MKSIAALVLLVGSYLPAGAEVSDDLKFCGALKSGAERLACYDAAARIASRPTVARPARAASPVDAQAAIPAKAPPPEPLPARNPFDGYYVAIGGGYGVASGRDVFVTGTTFDSAKGGSVNVVAGRNIGFDWGIVGIEVDGRWLGETATSSATILPSFFLDSGSGLAGYRYQGDLAAHAALRVGVNYGDSMVFAKAGIGVSRITETFVSDTTGIHYCDPALFPIFGFSCSPSHFGGINSAKITTWVPSAIFGLGVEQNWGPLFGRLGVDFEATNHRRTTGDRALFFGSSVDQLTWTTRGTAMIGVRF
jgi:hypothetical protein